MTLARRTVITNRNASWVVGYVQQQQPDGTWQRCSHSEWVFAIRNSTRESIPPPSGLEMTIHSTFFPVEYASMWDSMIGTIGKNLKR